MFLACRDSPEVNPLNNAIFNVLLGNGTAIAGANHDLALVFDGQDRWLAVQIATDPPMAPRQQIVSVANSIHAGTAADVNCTGCVILGTETSGSYDSTPDTIADDNIISQTEVDFNYAGSSSKGGPATSAEDVPGKDITPQSVSINSPTYNGQVIDSNGKWVGDPSGLYSITSTTAATLAPGSPATATLDTATKTLTLGIPEGKQGVQGP